jgi:hypothetical protein
MKRLIGIVLVLLLIPAPIAEAKTCHTTHTYRHSVYSGKNSYRWVTTCTKN